jgi:hypothetical protein
MISCCQVNGSEVAKLYFYLKTSKLPGVNKGPASQVPPIVATLGAFGAVLCPGICFKGGITNNEMS